MATATASCAAYPSLELVTSSRALALVGAFLPGGNGDHAIFHHPALISGQGLAPPSSCARGRGTACRSPSGPGSRATGSRSTTHTTTTSSCSGRISSGVSILHGGRARSGLRILGSANGKYTEAPAHDLQMIDLTHH